jgi:hypothetical protein
MHVLPALEHHTYSDYDVEEGGKKMFSFIFLWRSSEKGKNERKKIIFIPNHHFLMSEGSLNKV